MLYYLLPLLSPWTSTGKDMLFTRRITQKIFDFTVHSEVFARTRGDDDDLVSMGDLSNFHFSLKVGFQGEVVRLLERMANQEDVLEQEDGSSTAKGTYSDLVKLYSRKAKVSELELDEAEKIENLPSHLLGLGRGRLKLLFQRKAELLEGILERIGKLVEREFHCSHGNVSEMCEELEIKPNELTRDISRVGFSGVDLEETHLHFMSYFEMSREVQNAIFLDTFIGDREAKDNGKRNFFSRIAEDAMISTFSRNIFPDKQEVYVLNFLSEYEFEPSDDGTAAQPGFEPYSGVYLNAALKITKVYKDSEANFKRFDFEENRQHTNLTFDIFLVPEDLALHEKNFENFLSSNMFPKKYNKAQLLFYQIPDASSLEIHQSMRSFFRNLQKLGFFTFFVSNTFLVLIRNPPFPLPPSDVIFQENLEGSHVSFVKKVHLLETLINHLEGGQTLDCTRAARALKHLTTLEGNFWKTFQLFEELFEDSLLQPPKKAGLHSIPKKAGFPSGFFHISDIEFSSPMESLLLATNRGRCYQDLEKYKSLSLGDSLASYKKVKKRQRKRTPGEEEVKGISHKRMKFCECFPPWRGVLCDKVDPSMVDRLSEGRGTAAQGEERSESSSLSFPAVIVSLVVDREAEVLELQAALDSWWTRFNSPVVARATGAKDFLRNYPVVIFHDGISRASRQRLMQASGNSLWFAYVENFFDVPKGWLPDKDYFRMAHEVSRWNLGYRAAIRLHTWGVFEEPVIERGVPGLEYVMWMDTDAYFPGLVRTDFIGEMQSQDYKFGFLHYIRDPGVVTAGFFDWTQLYMEEVAGYPLLDTNYTRAHHIHLARSIRAYDDKPFLRQFMDPTWDCSVMMTDIEIMEKKFFIEEGMRDFFHFTDSLHGWWLHRWGGTAVHTFGAGMYLTKDKVYQFDTPYAHQDFCMCGEENSEEANLNLNINLDEVSEAKKEGRAVQSRQTLKYECLKPSKEKGNKQVGVMKCVHAFRRN